MPVVERQLPLNTVCKLTGLPRSALKHLIREHGVPVCKIGSMCRLKLSDVERALEAARQQQAKK